MKFDIKSDRHLIIKVAKSKGFTFPKTYTSPNGVTHNLNDNYIWITKGDKSNPRLNADFLINTVASGLYFRLYNSDIIGYIRNEKLMEILN